MTSGPELRFEWEWEPAPAVKAPELRATWSRLELRVGDQCVTRVEDRESDSSRRSIFVPLYPLAEWIAYNWWLLKADARPQVHLTRRRSSGRAAPDAASRFRRHTMREAGDGFLWPDLWIVP